MTREENIQKLHALVAEVGNRDISKLDLDHDLSDSSGMDSLGILELFLAVEKNFEVRFPDDELSNLKTLQDVLDVLETQLLRRKS